LQNNNILGKIQRNDQTLNNKYKNGRKKVNFSGGVKTIYRVYPALLNTQLLDNTDICHNGKSA